MVDPRPGRGADQFIVRFPEGLRDRIRDAAGTNKRSMNAEIIDRLERSFSDGEPPVIEVVLDANGLPLSWDEILVHVSEVRKALKVNAVSMSIQVVRSRPASNADRQDDADALRKAYRSRKRQISREALERPLEPEPSPGPYVTRINEGKPPPTHPTKPPRKLGPKK